MLTNRLSTGLAVLALTLPFAAPAVAQETGGDDFVRSLVWNERTVEHLLNRAGFGASPEAVREALARRPEEVVEDLVTGGEPVEPFYIQGPGELARVDRKGMTDEQKRRLRLAVRKEDRQQMAAYTNWWIDAMLAGADPLRDRMTLFWHGFFTSSYRDVRRSDVMARQHRMLREEALGSYAVMLRGIVHDPGMLKYLNNDANRKGKNNENLARELMELFSLGEGNYTEKDVQEVARALTGMRFDVDGEYRFRRGQHDFGRKEVLGEKGRLNGDDVVDILLEQEACARYVAGRVIEYLEGVAPTGERLDFYASLLRDANYELEPMLRSLLLDPQFYRAEVLGTRVQGPVDYLVGSAQRLDLELPSVFVREASAELGQELFLPPSVKGWEEGPAWITTSSLMLRGNLAGMTLGVVDLSQVFPAAGTRGLLAGNPRRGGDADDVMDFDSPDAELDDEMGDEMSGEMMGDEMMDAPRSSKRNAMPKVIRDLRGAMGDDYRPRIYLAWRLSRAELRTDEQIANYLLELSLAIEPPADLRTRVMDVLREEREALGAKDGELLDEELAEDVLRRALHWILSTPAAQLS